MNELEKELAAEKARADAAEATIASLTEQLAEVKRGLGVIAADRLADETWPTAYYRISKAALDILSRLEKGEA